MGKEEQAKDSRKKILASNNKIQGKPRAVTLEVDKKKKRKKINQ